MDFKDYSLFAGLVCFLLVAAVIGVFCTRAVGLEHRRTVIILLAALAINGLVQLLVYLDPTTTMLVRKIPVAANWAFALSYIIDIVLLHPPRDSE